MQLQNWEIYESSIIHIIFFVVSIFFSLWKIFLFFFFSSFFFYIYIQSNANANTASDTKTESSPLKEESSSPKKETKKKVEKAVKKAKLTKKIDKRTLIQGVKRGEVKYSSEGATRMEHCRLTFLLNLPLSNLFHCYRLVLLYLKHPNMSFFNVINIWSLLPHYNTIINSTFLL